MIACAGQPPESCAVAQIPMDHQLDVLAPFLPAEAAATLQALRLRDRVKGQGCSSYSYPCPCTGP